VVHVLWEVTSQRPVSPSSRSRSPRRGVLDHLTMFAEVKRCVEESVTMYQLTRRNTSEDFIFINISVRTSNNIVVPVCSFCVLLISCFHSYRHYTRYSGQFLTLHQWQTAAQPFSCVRHDELSPWSAVPVHSLDPTSTYILYDDCQP
jgi:hypothetical protein